MSDDTLASFAEIESLIAQLPAGDDEVADAVRARLPAGTGKLGDYAVWLARWQGSIKPQMRRPRAVFFASCYAPDPQQALTAQLVQSYSNENHPIYKLCEAIDCDLRVYELDLDHASLVPGDAQAAMSEEECGRAIAYGMMAVEPGIHALTLGTVSPSANIPQFVTGEKTPLEQLRHYGGYDAAAVFGAMLAARLANVLVLFSGMAAEFAHLILQQCGPALGDHCLQFTSAIIDDNNAGLMTGLSDLKLAAALI